MNPLFSKRLCIRQLKIEDASFILRLLNEPSWIEFIGDKNIHSIEDAEKYLNKSTFPMYQNYGTSLCLVKLKSTDESIGLCGLIKRGTLEDFDLGYAFLPEFWGNGYAVEAAQSTLTYGKEMHHLKRVVAITLENNTRCINVLTKLGFRLEDELVMDKDEELQLYSIAI